MKLSDEQFEFLLDVQMFIEWCALEHNLKITGGELYRTQYQQNHYFATGRSKVEHSYHQDRLAIDLNFFDGSGKQLNTKETMRFLGVYWESLNPFNVWGGNYRNFFDGNHFERAIWNTSKKNQEREYE